MNNLRCVFISLFIVLREPHGKQPASREKRKISKAKLTVKSNDCEQQ